MTFLAPWLLLGLAGVALPVLLHLFWKSRAKAHAFSTLMFLRSAIVRTARRRRVQNWLLMLLRCGLIALLVFAVAEPVSRAVGFLGGKGRDAVVIFDDSFSMSASAGDMTAFENARAGVLDLISRADAPLRMVMFHTAAPSPQEFSRMTDKLSDVRQAVSSAEVSYAHASPSAALAKAAELVSQNPAEVFIFSDFQKNSFELEKLLRSGGLEPLKDSPIYLIRARKVSPANFAVTSLNVHGPRVRGAAVNVMATVANYSQVDETLSVELILPDTQPLRKPIDLPAGTTQNISLPMELPAKGIASGQVRIKSDDSIRCDNARFFAFMPRPVIRALVVAEDEDSSDLTAAGRVLSLALDWRTDAEKTSTPWPVSVTRLKPAELNAAVLKNADAVFICGVGGMSPTMAKDLADFARSGGVVMFFTGPAFDAGVYGTTLSGELLPGTVSSAIGSVGPDAPAWKVGKIDASDALLADLYQSTDDFPQINVQRFVPVKPGRNTKVLMSLENWFPLLMRQTVGAGEVFWCTTSASPRWSNLPTTGVFLPVVLRAALWKAVTAAAPISYTSGDFVPLAGKGDWRFIPQLRVRNDKKRSIIGGGVLTDECTPPGLFEYSSGDIGGMFAINADSAESDCACYGRDELLKAFSDAGFARVYAGEELGQVLSGASRERRGYNWRSLLACLAILALLGELALSNRINTRKSSAA